MRPRNRNFVSKFAKDEDGAVMIMTIILMFLLIKAAFSTFNVGVVVADRIRLQATTDAAAYASATWQARFMNFCAYTRRAIIANYANVALISGVEANYANVKYYFDKEPFTITGCYFSFKPDPDNPPGMPRISVMILYPIYTMSKTALVDGEGRQCAEALSRQHYISQKIMYYYVAQPWLTVVPMIVEKANTATANGSFSTIKVPASYASWGAASFMADRSGMLNGSFVREIPIGELQDDVEARFDAFTDPSNFPLSVNSDAFESESAQPITIALPFFGCRPYWTFDLAWAADCFGSCSVLEICCIPPSTAWTMGFYTFNEPMDFSFEDKTANTKDKFYLGLYYGGNVGTDVLFGIPICAPCTMPIIDFFDADFPGEYDLRYGTDDNKVFDLVEDLPADQREPSVYVALKIDRENYINDAGTGKLIHNNGMPIGGQMRDMVAISRAKVFFQPRYDGEQAFAPGIYHPYWEAQLAPVWGSRGFSNAGSILRNNGSSLLAAMVLGKDLDSPIPEAFNRSSTLVSPAEAAAFAADIHY